MVLDTKNRLPGLVKEWEAWLRKAAEAAGDQNAPHRLKPL